MRITLTRPEPEPGEAARSAERQGKVSGQSPERQRKFSGQSTGSPERQRKVSGQGSPERRRKVSGSSEHTREGQGGGGLGRQLEEALGRQFPGRGQDQGPGLGEAGEGRTRTAEELYMELPEELRQLVDAAKKVKEEERKREKEERRREREEGRRAEEQERMVERDRMEREEEEVVRVEVVHCGRPDENEGGVGERSMEERGGVGGRSREERGGVGGRSVVAPIVSGLLPTLAQGGARKAPMSPGSKRRAVRQSR